MALAATFALLLVDAGAKAKAEPAMLATRVGVAESVAFMVDDQETGDFGKRDSLLLPSWDKDLLQSPRCQETAETIVPVLRLSTAT
jgi:hypothetical protein